MRNKKSNANEYGFLRVASVVPALKLGNISYNEIEIEKSTRSAESKGARLVVFPELSVTGYSIGDLLHQEIILKETKKALLSLALKLKKLNCVVVIGAPLVITDKLFNTAVAISKVKIIAIVPKTYLPSYKEFYEKRWFSSGRDCSVTETMIGNQRVSVGTDILLKIDGTLVAIEICEDLWSALPPSSYHALSGAGVIANLSSSNELVGKAQYRKDLIKNQSARCIAGYVYSASGVNESTMDIVFSGHAIIAENGTILNEAETFRGDTQMIISDIDIEHILADRERITSFADTASANFRTYRTFEIKLSPKAKTDLLRSVPQRPFIPETKEELYEVAQEVFNIQVAGLSTRLNHAKIKNAVIGLSGGLDSTLALLVAIEAFKKISLPLKNIHAFTMPGFGTTKTTKSSAHLLSKSVGINIEEIDITDGVRSHFRDIKHNERVEDQTFENVQARYRTMLLLNKANQLRAIMIGTGDLSEIALGWTTFGGDHMSHYNVNCGVPKTLVKHLIQWFAVESQDKKLKTILNKILETPISPELKRHSKGKIIHKTEDIIGPYELHDFFLYHFIRWGSKPKKILFLAKYAFLKKYSEQKIKNTLKIFIERFFNNQWKRSVMPDGPKVGSVSLSPRGDWRMPSDADAKLWIRDTDTA